MQKISNKLLLSIIELASKDASFSLKDCCKKLAYKHTTLYNWHRNLESEKWGAGYSKTEDGEPLEKETIEKFLNCFVFSNHASKILKRLLNGQCLKDRYCYAKQFKVLKSAFSKYPSVNFWLYANIGEPKDEILFYLGKNESILKKKYIDFHTEDDYTKCEYKYKEPEPNQKPFAKKKKSLWDYY